MLVAGVDSSTQSCKVVVVDADTGAVVRSGSAPHPAGTSCDPEAWWTALLEAIDAAGGLADVAGLGIGGQQHGLVALDADGQVIRDALLWNDTRSAPSAADLVSELGAETWANGTGSVPVASYTVTKLRWLADHEPDNAKRIAAICLPHDWLTWRASGSSAFQDLITDRSDASGTGYFDAVTNRYRRDLLAHALRISPERAEAIALPRVLGPRDEAGRAAGLGLPEVVLGPGCGDNAGAALGMGVAAGETWLSLGTSGVVAAVSEIPSHDPSGVISGFADATGRFLPLQCTLNASRIIDQMAALLGVGYDEFSALALAAPSGSHGAVFLPLLAGERSPNLPDATASLLGLTSGNLSRETVARAAVEGMLCLLGACVERLVSGGTEIERVLLIGGGAKSSATRQIAPQVLGRSVDVPPEAEYVALGAARQAAWVLGGWERPPSWPLEGVSRFTAEPDPLVQQRYNEELASWIASH